MITVKKAKNLNDLILLLRDMDSNMKNISNQFELLAKPNALNFSTTKSPFKSYNSAPIKPYSAVKIAVAFLILSTTTGTHSNSMDVFNVIRRGLILQKEKDRRNSLRLYRYCGELGYIAIDHRNPVLLATKRQATSVLKKNLMALVP